MVHSGVPQKSIRLGHMSHTVVNGAHVKKNVQNQGMNTININMNTININMTITTEHPT